MATNAKFKMEDLVGRADTRRTIQPVNPPAQQPFAPLGSKLPKEYFFSDRLANMAPPVSSMGPVQTGPGTPNSPFAALSGGGSKGPSTGDLARASAIQGLLDSGDILKRMSDGSMTFTQGLTGVAANVGDNLALNYIDKVTGEPISTYAGIADLVAQGVAPGSMFARLTDWVNNPVTNAVNYFTGQGAQAAGSAAASSGTASGASGATTGTTGGSALGATLGRAVALYGAYTGLQGVRDAYRVGDTKNAAVSGASAGASIGSLFGPLGTAAGGVIGGAVGILGTAAGGHDKHEAAAEGAWNSFRRNVEQGTTSFRDSGFPLSQAFEAADNATGYKELDRVMPKGPGGYPASYRARSYLIKELEAAQAAGKLPTSDEELRQVNGAEFFNQEIAPKIWGNGKVDQNLVSLMGHMMDNLISFGKEGYTTKVDPPGQGQNDPRNRMSGGI